MAEQKPLPKWILIVSALFALMELVVSIQLWISPQSVLEMADLNAPGVYYLFRMWATRQFALGFIIAFATIKRSAPMLKIAYLFLLVMFAGDLVIGIVQNETALIVSGLIMCVVSCVLLYAINRRK